MFDNRWENWTSDFAESFAAQAFDPSTRQAIPEILGWFAAEVRRQDPDFPDALGPGTLRAVVADKLPHLNLPAPIRVQVPEVIAGFLEYLQDSGRLGEGNDWAAQVRILGKSLPDRVKPDGGVKGVTIKRPAGTSATGRNDPCPCGSGKKFKKCCGGRS